jgi:tripeptide aminopeptidase
MRSPVVDLFLDAVRVDAMSLHEAPMAAFLRERLCGLPVRLEEDATGAQVGGECGNLICIPSSFDSARPAIALFAHMDTPRPTAGVRPVVTADRITSDGTTILGVDNRSGVSALLHVLRGHASGGGPGNFIVVFTFGEELGLYGSKFVDLSPYNVRMGFVFDCSKRPGTFIRSSVGCSLYTATFIGRTSHAGVAPEKGINAIHMASRALATVSMGRLDPRMTSNVGKISSGGATNVVPDRCIIEGEVRSFDPRTMAEHLGFLREKFEAAAHAMHGSVEFVPSEDFAPFTLDPEEEVFRTATEALRAVGLEPDGIEYLGGSDANMLNAKGLPTINLGIGAQNPHANDEFILIEDLHATVEIARELVKRSACLS